MAQTMLVTDGAANAAPEWVHLLPAPADGLVQTGDSRGPYTLSPFAEIITNSFADRDALEIDINHATFLAAPNGGDARAVGWIREMQARDDGLWGRVEWTEEGAKLVTSRAYRGISPVVMHASETDKRISRLANASLVNRPNLRGLTQLHQQETLMSFIQRMAKMLGLADDATEADIASSVEKALKSADGAGIRAAAADAADLARNIRLAASLGGEDDAMSVPVLPSADTAQQNNRAVANLRRLTAPPKTKQSPIAREAERERNAVMGLISGYEDELAILREIDPIQKEMLRNRETLANASAAERTQIEALITARRTETAAIETQQQMYDTLRSVGSTALDTLRESGGGLDDMFASLGNSLADLIWQATVLGEGPLASLFGSSGDGGLLGMFIGAIAPDLGGLPTKAGGGMINGPGTGTSDDVLMWGSNGEFVATAAATQKYRPILEAMNAGTLPAFAQGGPIGPTAANSIGYGGAKAADGRVEVAIRMDKLGNLFAVVERISGSVSARVVDSYDEGLPDRVREISEDTRAA